MRRVKYWAIQCVWLVPSRRGETGKKVVHSCMYSIGIGIILAFKSTWTTGNKMGEYHCEWSFGFEEGRLTNVIGLAPMVLCGKGGC